MIPKKYRLKQDKDFDILFEKGKYISGKFTGLKYLKISSAEVDRYDKNDLKIAFIVSTKVSKKAVERNRKKRQMRESVKELLDQEKIKKGYLLAIIAKKEILDRKFSEIKLGIEDNFKQADLIYEDS